MRAENDPFRNLPNLKGKILDHSRSNFREIDFTALDQKMRDAASLRNGGAATKSAKLRVSRRSTGE